jgi:hypothetical protein
MNTKFGIGESSCPSACDKALPSVGRVNPARSGLPALQQVDRLEMLGLRRLHAADDVQSGPQSRRTAA